MADEVDVLSMKLLGPDGCTVHTVFSTEYVLRWMQINNLIES